MATPLSLLTASLSSLPLSPTPLHSLESAFEVDPLFRKMSSTFDEGGAKGMLLANLEVESSGVGIVFDSKEDEAKDEGGRGKNTEDAEEVRLWTKWLLWGSRPC